MLPPAIALRPLYVSKNGWAVNWKLTDGEVVEFTPLLAAFTAVTTQVVTPLDANVFPLTEQLGPVAEKVTEPFPAPPEVVRITALPTIKLNTEFEITNGL
jgi:hypothetical protein